MNNNKGLMAVDLKSKVKYATHDFLHYSRLDSLYSRQGAIILMYHSIGNSENVKWVDPRNQLSEKSFEAHLRYLAAKRNVISLDELVSSINEGRSFPQGTVVITLDDGYRDNLGIAAPLLEKYNLPATIYLATGYIDRVETQWIDRLYSLFTYRTIDKLSLSCWDISWEELNWNHYKTLGSMLIPLSYEKRLETLSELEHQFKPEIELPKLTMNWEDVKNMVERYANISLGSHTVNHLDVSSPDNRESLIYEIEQSKKKIQDETGRKVIHFSCPYSRSFDRIPDLLRENGYSSCVMNDQNLLLDNRRDPFALGRVEAPQKISLLAHYTSGAYPALSQKILKGRY